MNSGKNYKRVFHAEYVNGNKENFEDFHSLEFRDGIIFVYGMLDVTEIVATSIRLWDVYFIQERGL